MIRKLHMAKLQVITKKVDLDLEEGEVLQFYSSK